jgi:hypothetical protein
VAESVEMKTESGAKTADASASGVPQPAIRVMGRKNSTVDSAK